MKIRQGFDGGSGADMVIETAGFRTSFRKDWTFSEGAEPISRPPILWTRVEATINVHRHLRQRMFTARKHDTIPTPEILPDHEDDDALQESIPVDEVRYAQVSIGSMCGSHEKIF